MFKPCRSIATGFLFETFSFCFQTYMREMAAQAAISLIYPLFPEPQALLRWKP